MNYISLLVQSNVMNLSILGKTKPKINTNLNLTFSSGARGNLSYFCVYLVQIFLNLSTWLSCSPLERKSISIVHGVCTRDSSDTRVYKETALHCFSNTLLTAIYIKEKGWGFSTSIVITIVLFSYFTCKI